MIGFATALWLGILLFVTEPDSTLALAFPEVSEISYLRSAFLGSLGSVTDAEALVAGLAIGERELLSEAAKEQMREVSLTHLVAVSGANLAIVMGAIWFLLGALSAPRWLRFLLSGLAMLGYVLLVGPESSVLRAGAMALAVLIALSLGRGTSAIHSLALAVAVLLLIDQSLAFDLGFALSVLATLGLLLGARPIADRIGFAPRPIALALGAGLAAQIFTLPVVLMIQPGFPIYAIIANLLVEPVVAPVTVAGIVAVLLTPMSPSLSHLATWFATIGTQWILSVAERLSSQEVTRFHVSFGLEGQMLIWGLVVGVIAAIRLGGKARAAASAFLVLDIVLLLTLSAGDLVRSGVANQEWKVMACDVGQGDALLVRDGDQTALIDVGREPGPIKKCLEDTQITRVDLLVLTHFDADHVGGITGLSEVELGHVLISGYEDDRPLVGIVEEFLSGRGQSVREAVSGGVASLGECRFVVLGPKDAQSANSSNDASITALFDCPSYQVLALADAPESAQRELLPILLPLVDAEKHRVVKVAHHGAADQLGALYSAFRPQVALYSVGKGNTYGHPTNSALKLTSALGAMNLRTDLDGAIGLDFDSELRISTAGKLAS